MSAYVSPTTAGGLAILILLYSTLTAYDDTQWFCRWECRVGGVLLLREAKALSVS